MSAVCRAVRRTRSPARGTVVCARGTAIRWRGAVGRPARPASISARTGWSASCLASAKCGP